MEIKNTKLQDYIKIFDLVLNEDILNNFLEICKTHNFENAKIIGSPKEKPYVDKALDKVIKTIRGQTASDIPKATDKQKAEWKAERDRRAAAHKPTGNPYKPRQGESD